MSIRNNQPLVSIILPAYNAEKYISRTLDSVLSQTYKNYELIIINDGSTDSTKLIIDKYKHDLDNKLHYIYQKNSGVSAARNRGILSSSGELIAFLDADDLWYPEKLKIQIDAYIKEPTAALIHTEVDKQEEFNGFLPLRDGDLDAIHKPFIDVFVSPNLKTPSVMIPRKVLDKVGLFNTDLPTAEDKDLFLRCCYKQLTLYIPQELVYCSVFPGSLCDDLRSYQDNINVIDTFVKNNPDFITDNLNIVNKVKSITYYECAEDLCYKNYCSLAMKEAIMSVNFGWSKKAVFIFFKSLVKYFILLFSGRLK